MAILDGLISWWSLDEESGVRVDRHGGKNLADNNTVLFDVGKVGNAADFEKDTNEFLSRANDGTFNLDVLSVAAWVKAETLQNASIVDKLPWAAGTNGWRLNVRDNGDVWFQYGSAAGTSEIAGVGGAYSAGTWVFLIGTLDGADIRLYVDDGVGFGEPCVRTYTAVGINLNLGRNDQQAVEHYDGLIDEVPVWNRVLTADERTWLYNGGAGRKYPLPWGKSHSKRQFLGLI